MFNAIVMYVNMKVFMYKDAGVALHKLLYVQREKGG